MKIREYIDGDLLRMSRFKIKTIESKEGDEVAIFDPSRLADALAALQEYQPPALTVGYLKPGERFQLAKQQSPATHLRGQAFMSDGIEYVNCWNVDYYHTTNFEAAQQCTRVE